VQRELYDTELFKSIKELNYEVFGCAYDDTTSTSGTGSQERNKEENGDTLVNIIA
jgi:hypothetical protein